LENQTLRLQDIKDILVRRKYSLFIPFLTIFLVAAAVALLLPPIFISSSTILIEEQEIPPEYVQTTVTSYVEKRLQEIKQKIMSTTRLQEIIDEYELYTDWQGRKTREEIIGRMRDDINLELISAEVLDRRTGRSTSATIAFTLSYEGKNDPAKVQRVASKLTSLFLEENLKVRQRQVQEASRFFEDEIHKIEESLHEFEASIAVFKEENINELPELMSINLQDMHKVELSIERADEQLRGLKEREAYLQAELASVSPQLADQERHGSLKLELTRLKTLYSDEYPDIIQLKKEIVELEKSLSGNPDHADSLSQPGKPTNPAYITLSSQLSGAQSEIVTIKEQIKNFEEQRDLLRKRIQATPVVEQEYKKMLMERDSLKLKYDDLMQKFMEARVAQGLEKEQKGERFTLIDPALLPEKPYKPNRLAILLIGVVVGVGFGAGLAAILEFSDDAIRDTRSLNMATNIPVLATIPVIDTEQKIAGRKQRRKIMFLLAGLVLILTPVVFHFFVMDFYVFWAKLSRNLTF